MNPIGPMHVQHSSAQVHWAICKSYRREEGAMDIGLTANPVKSRPAAVAWLLDSAARGGGLSSSVLERLSGAKVSLPAKMISLLFSICSSLTHPTECPHGWAQSWRQAHNSGEGVKSSQRLCLPSVPVSDG